MKRKENSSLIMATTKKAGNSRYINIIQKANQIANTVIMNNCEIVRISKGKAAFVEQEIKGNQVKVIVPKRVSMDRLAFHIENQLSGRKKVKIEIVGYQTSKRKKVAVGYKHSKNAHLALKSKKEDDDGSGTGCRRGKRARRLKR